MNVINVIDGKKIIFFFINWFKSENNNKTKLATFPPACFCCEFAVLEIWAVWILMLLPLVHYLFVQNKIERTSQKYMIFLSLKNRMGVFRIVPETASDIIFLYCIKVGALNLPPLW